MFIPNPRDVNAQKKMLIKYCYKKTTKNLIDERSLSGNGKFGKSFRPGDEIIRKRHTGSWHWAIPGFSCHDYIPQVVCLLPVVPAAPTRSLTVGCACAVFSWWPAARSNCCLQLVRQSVRSLSIHPCVTSPSSTRAPFQN